MKSACDGCSSEAPALAIFPGALGDLICAAPALAALVERHRKLELAVKQAHGWLACVLTGAAPAAPLEDRCWSSLFAPGAERSASHWLGTRPAVYSWLGASDDCFRRAVSSVTKGRARFYRVIRGDGRRHVSCQYMEEVGVVPSQEKWLRPGRRLRKALGVEELYRGPSVSKGGPLRLLIHPGSGSVGKCWESRGFKGIAEWWQGEVGGMVEVLLGPVEAGEERYWAKVGLKTSSGKSLLQAAQLIASADLFVGNDSGISHLAGALGAAGVVIFGPTDPARWLPLGGELIAVVAQRRMKGGAEACRPGAGGQAASGLEVKAGEEGRGGASRISLGELPVSMVVQALTRLLVKGKSAGNSRLPQYSPP